MIAVIMRKKKHHLYLRCDVPSLLRRASYFKRKLRALKICHLLHVLSLLIPFLTSRLLVLNVLPFCFSSFFSISYLLILKIRLSQEPSKLTHVQWLPLKMTKIYLEHQSWWLYLLLASHSGRYLDTSELLQHQNHQQPMWSEDWHHSNQYQSHHPDELQCAGP